MVLRTAQTFSGPSYVELRLLWSIRTLEEAHTATRDSPSRLRTVNLRPGCAACNAIRVAFDLFKGRLPSGPRDRRHVNHTFHSRHRFLATKRHKGRKRGNHFVLCVPFVAKKFFTLLRLRGSARARGGAGFQLLLLSSSATTAATTPRGAHDAPPPAGCRFHIPRSSAGTHSQRSPL